MKFEKGYVQIYTGNGKGKTTAAIGQAIRAAGHGLRTCIFQFMKDYPYGEISVLNNHKDLITIKRFGNDAFVFKKCSPSKDDLQKATEGLKSAEMIMLGEEYNIIPHLLKNKTFKFINELWIEWHSRWIGNSENLDKEYEQEIKKYGTIIDNTWDAAGF